VTVNYKYDAERPASRVVAIGAAVVAALCLAFLTGYAMSGRSGASDATPSMPPKREAAPSVITSPTTPDPVRDPGGLHLNARGVITGYAHTQGGAVAAAGNYTAALYVQRNRSHARELAVLNTICATKDDAVRLAGDFSSEDTALSKILDVSNLQSPGVVAYGHPVGYQVASYSANSATVDAYVVGGQGIAGAPGDSAVSGETFYEVDEVQLTWRDADWRLSNWSHLAQTNGPELASVAAESYLPFPLGQASSK
jgi:hypothetical protein